MLEWKKRGTVKNAMVKNGRLENAGSTKHFPKTLYVYKNVVIIVEMTKFIK